MESGSSPLVRWTYATADEVVITIGSGTCDEAMEGANVAGVVDANSYAVRKKTVHVDRNRSYNSEKKLYFSSQAG